MWCVGYRMLLGAILQDTLSGHWSCEGRCVRKIRLPFRTPKYLVPEHLALCVSGVLPGHCKHWLMAVLRLHSSASLHQGLAAITQAPNGQRGNPAWAAPCLPFSVCAFFASSGLFCRICCPAEFCLRLCFLGLTGPLHVEASQALIHPSL